VIDATALAVLWQFRFQQDKEDTMSRPSIKYVAGWMASILLALFLAFPVHAGTKTGDTWHFQLGTYGWLSGQKGTLATQPGLPAVDVDLDFYDDIAGNINGAFALIGEVHKGRVGVVGDVNYSDIEDDEATAGPFFSTLTSRTRTWIASAAGFYRLIERDRAFLDGMAGLRYWSVDSSLKLGTGILPAREISNREDWVDPIIGLKGLAPFGESQFFVSGALLLGGFGMGSDFMWDGQINLGYQWGPTFSTTIGYRYLEVDYDEGDFLYDVSQDGPSLGLSWRF
jgi:hypothetical protein